MQIDEAQSAAADQAPGMRDGYEFTALGATDEVFTKLHSQNMTQRFFKWGIRLNEDLYVRKYRYNQAFHPVGIDDFLKQLFNSDAARASLPMVTGLGEVSDVRMKQMTCSVVNMSYFDFFEELNIINPATSNIQGCIDEYIHGIQCADKLRTGLLWEDDENFCELQQDKYQNEFIFKLLQFVAIGGSLNQYEQSITEYLDVVKDLYKDLVCVAKDEATDETKPMSLIYKITGLKSAAGGELPNEDEHPQNFTYVIVDPLKWHAIVFQNKWTKQW